MAEVYVCAALVCRASDPPLHGSGPWIMPVSDNGRVLVGILGALHPLYTLLLALHARWRRRDKGFLLLVVESALTYGVISIVFAGFYCAGALSANMLLPSITQLQVSSH